MIMNMGREKRIFASILDAVKPLACRNRDLGTGVLTTQSKGIDTNKQYAVLIKKL